jgi:hypothetical protein
MSKPPRIEFPGAVYHALSRGYQGKRIFIEDKDFLRFQKNLSDVKEKFGIKIHAHVVKKLHRYRWSSYREYLTKWLSCHKSRPRTDRVCPDIYFRRVGRTPSCIWGIKERRRFTLSAVFWRL